MYAPQMLSVCHRYSNNSDDAKDIFQQAFYQIYKNIGQIKDYRALSGWVKRIFVNVALQHYKKNQALFIVEDLSNSELNLLDSIDPLSHMLEDEIIQLIQKLPEGCRKVFNMYAIEGYSHKEIAKELNISTGTSKSQLHDARKILKKAILKNDRHLSNKLS
jgi:RNA polymerase sigma-70 factor (ECF subfamily)